MSAAAEVRVRVSSIWVTFTVCQALCRALSSRAGVGGLRRRDRKSFPCHPNGVTGIPAQEAWWAAEPEKLESLPPAAVPRGPVL